MTAQPDNRFVLCVVVLEFAVSGNQALVCMFITMVSVIYIYINEVRRLTLISMRAL